MRNFLAGVAAMALVIGALGAAYALGSSGGMDESRVAMATISEATPTGIPSPSTSMPSPETPIPPPPTSEPVIQLFDRTTCAEIRGTDYRSDSERLWFVVNCRVMPAPEPQPEAFQLEPEVWCPLGMLPRLATLDRTREASRYYTYSCDTPGVYSASCAFAGLAGFGLCSVGAANGTYLSCSHLGYADWTCQATLRPAPTPGVLGP